MTKENRLTDIENYLTYLNGVHLNLRLPDSVPVTILGFSQGAATISRWVTGGKIAFDRMILWSGIFPPDMDLESAKDTLRGKKIILVHGTEDPFLNDSQYQSMEMISTKLEIHPQVITFKGGHEIDATTLKQLILKQ